MGARCAGFALGSGQGKGGRRRVVVVWKMGEEKEVGDWGNIKRARCGTGKWRRRWCSTARLPLLLCDPLGFSAATLLR
jgi:hypothetical protein